MTFKTLAEVLSVTQLSQDGQVKYPLDCGCKSPHESQMCFEHQTELIEDRRRFVGMHKLMLSHRDFLDLTSLATTLQCIRLELISNPTKSCLIKIIPDPGAVKR